jgi:iron complex transport system substrate-binding protein
VRELPVCTGPRFATEGTSLEIDQRVKATLQTGLSVYAVDTGLLQQLRPDLILTQSHCDVCAVSEKDVSAALEGWPGPPPRVVALAPNTLEDAWHGIRQVGSALGIPERGDQVVRQLQGRMEEIAARTRSLGRNPAVVCLEWIEPLMAAGNWMPTLVRLAAGNDLLGRAGQHSPYLSWEGLTAADPEVLVVLPCGFDLGRSVREMRAAVAGPAAAKWRRLRAVQDGRVAVCDGNQFFNLPGPRLVESLEILAEVLHPEGCRFGHEGTGWQWL